MTGAARPGPVALLAAGCGTAVASVCALGLVQIQRSLPGPWAVAAVVTAGAACAVLARALGRLSEVVPSGAGLPAYLSRAFGRRVGLRLALPYLFLMIALAGIETRIVGTVLGAALDVPAWTCGLVFLLVTWGVCRAGVRPGYRAQVIATAALLSLLAAAALIAIAAALLEGRAPGPDLARPFSPSAFLAAVGQAFFLFLGFELVASHVEVAGSARPIGLALRRSVAVLTAFYALLAAGFATLPVWEPSSWLTPQLTMAEAAGGAAGVAAVTVACLLASYTSFNGALLALSRLVQALSSQGVFPRLLARVDPGTLVPARALDVLVLGAGTAALLCGRTATRLVLGAAAGAATLLYASALWARERAPYREPGRSSSARVLSGALAVALLLLGCGAVIEAVVAVGGTAAAASEAPRGR